MRSKTDRRICGTCEYWTGAREPSFDSKGVPKIEINDKFGFCEKQDYRYANQERKNDAKCAKYSKWTEIL